MSKKGERKKIMDEKKKIPEGNLLIQTRYKFGLTQHTMGQLMGMQQYHISRIEHDIHLLTKQQVVHLLALDLLHSLNSLYDLPVRIAEYDVDT